MKVFISQPMNGLTDEEVLKYREEAINYLKSSYGEENIEVLETYIEDAPKDAGSLWYLGKSIQMLEQADVIYCVEGWEKARGCIIERMVGNLYGIKIID